MALDLFDRKLRWGILATGQIARAFVHAQRDTEHCEVVAVYSRTAEQAQAFTDENEAGKPYADLDVFLADDQIDAVYVASPNPMHVEHTIRCLEAGKHVMCEKPIAINGYLAEAMFDTAAARGLLLMEAFKDRLYPQTAEVVQWIRDGLIGEVQLIEASFAFRLGENASPEGRLMNPALGGGGILDVGCYATNFVRLIAGAAIGKTFDDPSEVTGVGRISATGVDEIAQAGFRFDSGILATVTTGIQLAHANALTVYGTKGRVFTTNPWGNEWYKGDSFALELQKPGMGSVETIRTSESTTPHAPFTAEGDCFARAVLSGTHQVASPAMTPEDSLGLIQTLDRWRAAVGVRFPMEDPAQMPGPVHGHALRVPALGAGAIPTASIPNLDRSVSRLIMGCDNQTHSDHARVMFDLFLEAGGNTFDTAWIYGRGVPESMLGAWLKARGAGVRDQINILNKGAHTPWCNPSDMREQLRVSLDRLGTDHIDLYIMHRDNEDIPAGEFVALMNEWKDQGLVSTFGGSNWSPQRFEEANAWAEANGKQGFSILNNNLSLARMVNPVWNGCIASSEPSVREWLTKTNTVHLAWSSQARGFFTDRVNRAMAERVADLSKRGGANNNPSESETARCWFSDDNFARRDRAFELAEKHNVSALNIALAYVLNQPFPSFALIGPRRPVELRTSLPGATLKLSPEELAYLDLRADAPAG